MAPTECSLLEAPWRSFLMVAALSAIPRRLQPEVWFSTALLMLSSGPVMEGEEHRGNAVRCKACGS